MVIQSVSAEIVDPPETVYLTDTISPSSSKHFQVRVIPGICNWGELKKNVRET